MFRGLFIEEPKNLWNSKSELLLSKLVDKAHCNALINPLKKSFGMKAVLFTPGPACDISPYRHFRKTRISTLIKTLRFLNKNWDSVIDVYAKRKIQITTQELYNTLFYQLTSILAWKRLFNKFRPKLVVVDFDRDNINAPLVLSAQSEGIKTVTLVHGVVTTPFGFSPVIADEIWCWSEFQKSQFDSGLVDPSCITPVGSAIAERYDLDTKPDSGHGQPIIGIGINPASADWNRSFILHIFSHLPDSMEVLVKLHPSMKIESWMEDLSSGHSIVF